MIKTIIIILVFYYIAKYIITNLKHIRTGEPDENNINFWMFTYDFKMRKRDSIFDRVSKDIIEKRKLKNKLILLLYVTVGIIFFHTNLLLTQILLLILEKN